MNTANGRTPLPDTIKKRLKSLIVELRRMLEDDLGKQLKRLGFDAAKSAATPIEKLTYLTAEEIAARRVLDVIAAKEQAVVGSYAGGIEALRREAAYTHLNRLVGLKCLELRGHLSIDGEPTEVVTIRSEYGDRSKWLWVLRERDPRYRFGEDAEEILWREGLTQACAAITAEIGVLFDPAEPYAQVWPSHRALRAAIDRLNELPDEAFHADELLGWVYQYFQSDEKDRVFEAVRTQKTKIAGADIVPVTQLYTEQYMVDFLLQNSLGARWMEMYPDSNAKTQWPYYVTPATPHTRPPKPLKSWKLLDPSVGSGHFEVAAFDLFAQLYAEERALAEAGRIPREWAVAIEDVAATILANNLHGIDIDPRAVQLATLALYLKAKEYQPHPPHPKGKEEAHSERSEAQSKSARPSTPLRSAQDARARYKINIVAADASFLQGEAWTHFLNGFDQEPSVRRVLEALAHSLENIRELGSLLRPEVELRNIIAEEHHRWETQVKRGAEQQFLFPELEGVKQEALPFEDITDDEFWNRLVYRAEAAIRAFMDTARTSGEIDERVVAGEAQRGFAFLELCQQHYDVVCTNPPYMGISNMGAVLKDFVSKHYPAAKHDLYASFMLRCLDLAIDDGHVAMVTQQSWMFLKRFAELRSSKGDQDNKRKKTAFRGLLREATIDRVAHLGAGAFSEIGGEVVNVVVFTLRKVTPDKNHRITALRLIGTTDTSRKSDLLQGICGQKNTKLRYEPIQTELISIPSAPLAYWLSAKFIELLAREPHLSKDHAIGWGVSSSDNNRFLRLHWEIPFEVWGNRWLRHAKGGGFGKWFGFEHWLVDWDDNGHVMKAWILQRYPYLKENYEIKIRPYTFFRTGWTYSSMTGGTPSFRWLDNAWTTNAKSPQVVANNDEIGLGSLLNSRVSTYLLKSLSSSLNIDEGYVGRLPFDEATVKSASNLTLFAIRLKRLLIQRDALEMTFRMVGLPNLADRVDHFEALLSEVDAVSEITVLEKLELTPIQVDEVFDATSKPVGWYPYIIGYDAIPEVPPSLLPLPPELLDHLATHPRLTSSPEELARIKARLRAWYIAGPGAKDEGGGMKDEADSADEADGGDEEDNVALGARIPIPAETFLEELSQKMELHPISVYWLLEELRRAEGLICPPELKRQTEDYFTVKLLRMLGHRWPMQDQYEQEQDRPFIDPRWIDEDGIIPLTPDSGDEVLIDRLHRFLDAEFGPERGPAVEVEAAQILGWKPGDEWGAQKPLPLARWFERDFFKRHGSQFKKRPIAWHLSSAKGHFQVIVYYHKFDRDRLTLLRARYVRDRLDSLRKQLGQLQADASELDRRTLNAIADLEAKIADVQDFDDRLRRLLEGREREARIWCPWKAADEQPVGWQPDINDGVRVNIAPVQRLGLLAADVLAAKDVRSLLAPVGRE